MIEILAVSVDGSDMVAFLCEGLCDEAIFLLKSIDF